MFRRVPVLILPPNAEFYFLMFAGQVRPSPSQAAAFLPPVAAAVSRRQLSTTFDR